MTVSAATATFIESQVPQLAPFCLPVPTLCILKVRSLGAFAITLRSGNCERVM